MEPRTDQDSLWWLVAPLGLWLLHFCACYALVALGCPRLSEGTVYGGLAALSALALAGIGWLGWIGGLRYRSVQDVPAPAAGPAARHQFLALSVVLSAVLGVLGAIYVAGSAWLVGGCS